MDCAGGRTALPRKPRGLAALGKPTEMQVQREIVNFAKATLVGARIIAIPNAARRNPGGKAGNAVPGLTIGAPDLFVVGRGGKLLFIEVKSATGCLSDEQYAFKNWCIANAVPMIVARSQDDVRAAFAQFGFPTREAKA